MLDLLYYTFIFPLEYLMRLALETAYAATGHYGASIIILSFVVNIVILPLYYLAQKWKTQDMILQGAMSREIRNIKRSYKGKERYFYIKTVYRRFGYHPSHSIKASMGFLIQIPFFFAAFHLLSNYAPLSGVSFWGIKDLGAPDALLGGVHLLPLLMTAANLLSAYVYLELLSKSEKIQLYALAAVFLVVLYNEASGLLLYWTFNNLFSLAKNILEKKLKLGPLFSKKLTAYKEKRGGKKHAWRERLLALHERLQMNIWLFVLIAAIGFEKAYEYFVPALTTGDRNLLLLLETITIFTFLDLVLLVRYIVTEKQKNAWFQGFLWLVCVVFGVFLFDFFSRVIEISPIKFQRENIAYVAIGLFVILGLASALKKAAFLQKLQSPFALYALIYFALLFLMLVLNPVLLYISDIESFTLGSKSLLANLFLVFFAAIAVVVAVFFAASKVLRSALILAGNVLSLGALLYSFVIVKNYGLIDHFIFHTPEKLVATRAATFFEVLAIAVFIWAVSVLLYKYASAFKKIYIVINVMLLAAFASNIPHKEEAHYESTNGSFDEEKRTILNFSPEKNVLVFFLDGFRGDDMQNIFNKDKDLLKEYTGFTWYRNTLSTGTSTCDSIAAVFAGHSYTVENIEARGSIPQEEVNKAYSIFPNAFIPKGYQVSYFYTQYLSKKPKDVYIYDHNPKYDHKYNLDTFRSKVKIEKKMLYVISFFKAIPMLVKKTVYSNGTWLGFLKKEQKGLNDIQSKSGHWGFLKLLVSDAGFTNPQKTLKYLQFGIPHDPYVMTRDETYDIEKASDYTESYVAIKKIGELIKKFKAQGIYDKTKIILMSDHGWWRNTHNNIQANFSDLVSRGYQDRMSPGMVNPLLMVKDFNEGGEIKQSDLFMSNADVPSIVCSVLDNGCGIEDKDPTKVAGGGGRKLIISTTTVNFSKDKDYGVKDQWQVTGSIFDPKNWKRLK